MAAKSSYTVKFKTTTPDVYAIKVFYKPNAGTMPISFPPNIIAPVINVEHSKLFSNLHSHQVNQVYVFNCCDEDLTLNPLTADITYQLQILKLVDRVNNELGTNAKLEVKINLHSFNSAIVGV